MPKSSRDSTKGRSKKSSDASDGPSDSSRPSSLPPPAPSQRERPSSVPASALPLISVEAEPSTLGDELQARGRQDSGVEHRTDGVDQDERPSVPATPSARRAGSEPFLAAPTFLGSPPAPSNLSVRTDDSSASIRLDEAALLDPEGDDDDYSKTPIASIKNLARAPTAPSLRPNIIPGKDRPKRDTMVGFPAPPVGAPRPASVPVPPASGTSKPYSLPPAPTPPRSAPPAPPSSAPGLRAGSLPPMPAPPPSGSGPSRIPIPPLPVSSSLSAGSSPSRVPVPPPPAAASSAAAAPKLPSVPSAAHASSRPPPAPIANAAVYTGPTAPPASRRPELPLSSVYDDGDDDEVTNIFVPGSEAAMRLGESATLRSLSAPPATPRSAPRGSMPAPLSSSVVPARAAVSARPPSSRDQKTVPPVARLSAPPVQVQPISSMPVPSYDRYPQPRKSSAGRWLAVVAGFAVAAAVLFFLFVPRTGGLLITVARPGALPVKELAIYVDGESRCSESPCTVAELKAGSHLVRVQAAGFEATADQAIVVNPGADAVHNFMLTPAAALKSKLEVSAGLPGTKVFVDDTARGLLPLSLSDLEPREYKLRFEAGDRFEPLEQRVTLKPGETSKLEPSGWVLKRGKLTLSLPARFRAARVQLDGKTLRKFPATFELDAKEPHQLSASLRGYETLEQSITLSADQPEQQLAIELQRPGEKAREEAAAAVSTPTPSAATAPRAAERDQEPAQPEPLASRTPTTPADGHKTIFNTAIASGSKESAPKEANPAAEPAAAAFGTLNINSIPSTTVIVNGKTLGRTPRMGLKVKPGTQSIVFIHPEKGKKQTQVEVPAGDTKTVAVRF